MAIELRLFGRTGVRVSNLCLGTMLFGTRTTPADSYAIVDRAIEAGINFFDSANVYGRGRSEEVTGEALKRNGKRDRIVLATKFHGGMSDDPNDRGASRRHILAACEASLKRLDTDYIDLYQIHRPRSDTAIDETLRALDDLVHQGKVRYIGCSNFSAWQTCEANWMARANNLNQFVSAQPEYNMLNRSVELELVPFCHEYNIGILPFYPLASGFLTGKYRQGEPVPEGTRLAGNQRAQGNTLTEKNFNMLAKLENFAEERGHPMVELAIAWLLGNSAVSSVIAGATKNEQVTANVKAADWVLTPEDMTEIDEILRTGD